LANRWRKPKKQILISADKALYSAKGTGRNKTSAPKIITGRDWFPQKDISETQRIAIGMIYALAATVDAKDHYNLRSFPKG